MEENKIEKDELNKVYASALLVFTTAYLLGLYCW